MAQQVLTSVCAPLTLRDQQILVTASIGICMFPDKGGQANDLIRNADVAMYRAKRDGRNRYELYARELSEEAAEPS